MNPRLIQVVGAAASPLAQPKSTQRVGLPQALTLAAMPADSPPSPARIEVP